jgi:hypothetical protein
MWVWQELNNTWTGDMNTDSCDDVCSSTARRRVHVCSTAPCGGPAATAVNSSSTAVGTQVAKQPTTGKQVRKQAVIISSSSTSAPAVLTCYLWLSQSIGTMGSWIVVAAAFGPRRALCKPKGVMISLIS